MQEQSRFPVTVIGGSVAGLMAAREIAQSGIGVCVYEEHREIGVPEKCDGLVSSHGISELGLVPPSSVVQNSIERARFFSPSLREIEVRAGKQGVIVLDRNQFDKYLAENAARAGAKIEVGKRVSQYTQADSKVTFRVDSETLNSDYLIDCSGYESYISSGGKALQGGQYLVHGSWFDRNAVEIYVDPVSYPGFFKWVIPISDNVAKIGVAGEGINTFQILDAFVREKDAVVFRKMAAPVLCYGTIKSFVENRIAKAGDAAGQPKPTTGGGIYTGGYGGMLAGRAVVQAFRRSNSDLLSDYESGWKSKFGREFRLQSYARNVISKMNRGQIERLFEMVASSELPSKISEEGDFDMHSIAIVKALGISNLVSAFGMFFTNELKSLLGA
jgi:digeranylgeranylglycerophospholipid reductase